MDERDLEAEHPNPRRLVDQLGACGREMRKRGPDVAHLVRNVVHARAPRRQKAAHRRVLVERFEQLEPAPSHANRCRFNPLLVDTRAVLEACSEEALVRHKRTVEVVDREADMVHRVRRLHTAIVFERLAPTMRVSALALVLASIALAGCGGQSSSAKPNGEASKPADRVFADAIAAATSASSVHVSGSIRSNGTAINLDLSMVKGKGATGSMSTNGLEFDLVRIGDTVYIRGSDAFYKRYAPPAFLPLLRGNWLKASATSGRFRSLAPLTGIAALLAKVRASHGKLVNEGDLATYHGQHIVQIRDTSDGSWLYVAATGTPYPVAIIGGKKSESGTITFGDWNQSVSLTAPKNALDISKF
jgi:hypothetical protein